jgi:hypothetical protein
MHLAPLASALNAMLAGLPFAITEELDPGAVDQKGPRVVSPRLSAIRVPTTLPQNVTLWSQNFRKPVILARYRRFANPRPGRIGLPGAHWAGWWG